MTSARPGRPAWFLFLAALAIVFDGIDNQLLGVSIPALTRTWHVSRAAFAPVVSLSYVGMLFGGALAGAAGDRVGRRAALIGSMLLFGGGTLAAAFAGSPGALGGLRLVAGIGLGGALTNGATLAAEYVGPEARALAVTTTVVCIPLGAMFAGILGSQLLAHHSWRLLFAVGGAAPVVLALLFFVALPESPHFADRPATPAVPLSRLFSEDLRRDTFLLWLAFGSCLLAVYLGFSWLPSLLANAGFEPSFASSGITAFNLGGVVGALAAGRAFALVGSRRAMLVMCAGAIGGAVALSMMHVSASGPRLPLFALLTLTGGLINAVQTTMYALAAHVYTSEVRARGIGFAMGIGRIGAIASGYSGAWAIDYRGGLSYFGLMALAMTTCLVALGGMRRHVPAGITNGSR